MERAQHIFALGKTQPFLGSLWFPQRALSLGMTGVGKTSVNGHFTVELSLHLLPPLKGITHLPLFIFMDGMQDYLRQVVRRDRC